MSIQKITEKSTKKKIETGTKQKVQTKSTVGYWIIEKYGVKGELNVEFLAVDGIICSDIVLFVLSLDNANSFVRIIEPICTNRQRNLLSTKWF